MKKIIFKTVILTLISLVAVFLITYGCIAGSSPKFLADIWSDLGSYDISVKYYEKQYEKTQDIYDLALLCNKVNEQNDSARAARSLKLLTEDKNFAVLCNAEDNSDGYTFTAFEYYFGKYAVAEYFESGINSAILIAEKSVTASYTEHSAFYSLLGIESLTKSDGEKIVAAITEIKGELSDDAQKGYAERDIGFANGL